MICGVPGSGKSTTARQLQSDGDDVVIMSPDDWMDACGISLWDGEVRALFEAQQWELTKLLLARGRTVVIEWGTWARSERDVLRQGARNIGATTELVWLDVDSDEVWRRVSNRDREDPPITTEQVLESIEAFEPPDAAELATYDRFTCASGAVTAGDSNSG